MDLLRKKNYLQLLAQQKNLKKPKSKKIFDINKVKILFDAILNIEEYLGKVFDKNFEPLRKIDKGYFLAAGRFTKQKNYIYLVREFKKFLNVYPNEKLILIGDGELKKKIKSEILNNNLSNNVFLFDYTDNIYFYMRNSCAFILSSLWEEVGFVIVEAALCNSFIISSNCENGPKRIFNE